jgi:hypothetical protein
MLPGQQPHGHLETTLIYEPGQPADRFLIPYG